ncbi:MAG: radical SAM family heme chaperone HemW [Acidobacteriota bacterium]
MNGRATTGRDAGLYVHVPFCASRCSYCAFVTTTEVSLLDRTVRATVAEIGRYATAARLPLATVYLGGGTPSLLPVADVEALLRGVREGFTLLPGAEVTLEANPDDVKPGTIEAWRGSGITRVSLGVQSFADPVLSRLNRRHGAEDARAAARAILGGGLELSVDLMLGLPGRSEADLDATLAETTRLRPHHVSVYLLEMDKPHELSRLAARRPELFPDDDGAARQYLRAGSVLVGAGYRHYEVSNFALPGHVARHNLRYWTGRPVFAAGVAAHGQAGRRRWANVDTLSAYLEASDRGGSVRSWSRRLDESEALRESVMLGLRRARGVSVARARACAVAAPEFGERLDDFTRLGLARVRDGRVGLSPRGWLLSNELLASLW